jgi:butyrate kinase
MKKILTINPGSTSTKLAFFEDYKEVMREELHVNPEDAGKSTLMLDQLPSRLEAVQNFISEKNIDLNSIDMIVARGGSMNGVRSGAYAVDDHVLVLLENAPRTQHASSMASFIGTELARLCHNSVLHSILSMVLVMFLQFYLISQSILGILK